MKKVLVVLSIMGSIGFVSCGPSAIDIEKAKQDSIAKADSIATAQAEVIAAQEKAKADSVEAAAAAEKEKK